MKFNCSKDDVLFVDKENMITSKGKNIYSIIDSKYDVYKVFSSMIKIFYNLNTIEGKIIYEFYRYVKNNNTECKFSSEFIKDVSKNLYISMSYVRSIIGKFLIKGIAKRTINGVYLEDKLNIFKEFITDDNSSETKSIIINFI